MIPGAAPEWLCITQPEASPTVSPNSNIAILMLQAEVGFVNESRLNGPFVLDTMLVSKVHYRTTKGSNTRSYGLGCDFVSWMIQFATN
ncbi:hypothetical protein TNCV_4787351 [Trichonephila clavipes]|nr:hypothetical protein TNCV_4787351 [Trichonephila clavipes]